MSSNIITDKELYVTKFWLLRGGVLLISNNTSVSVTAQGSALYFSIWYGTRQCLILQDMIRHKTVPHTSVSGTAQGSALYFSIWYGTRQCLILRYGTRQCLILQYLVRHKAVPHTSVSSTAQGSASYFSI